jgi:hypothetical protein
MKRASALLVFAVILLSGGAAAAAGAQDTQGPVNRVIGNVLVPAGSVVQGDVAVAVGNVQVDGIVTGSVSVGVGNVVVNGRVGGDVRVGVGQIGRGPRGTIAGVTQVGMAPDAGRFPRRLPLPLPLSLTYWGLTAFRPLFGILRWLGAAALALPIVALFPDAVGAVVTHAAREPLRAGLLGLAAFVLAVPVFILVAVTIVGIPIVVLATIVMVAALFFGYVAVAVWVGEAVLTALRGPGLSRLWAVLAGSFLIALAGLVPLLGGLVSVAVSAVGLGAILLWRFHGLRGRPAPVA